MIRLLKQSYKYFSTTIFDKILDKSIPSKPIYEDQHIYAFHDIKPQAPVHILIIPKNKDGLSGISQAQPKNKEILGHMLVSVPTIAAKAGLTNGYRLDANRFYICISTCQAGDKCAGRQVDSRLQLKRLQEQILYMNQSQIRISTRSSFHQRRQNELSNFLVNEIGLDAEVAHVLLKLHQTSNLRDTMDLFLQGDDGLVNHFYIPNQDKQKYTCRVCQRSIKDHRQADSETVQKELKQQQEQSNNLISQVLEAEVNQLKKVCEICYIEVIEADMVKIREQFHNICLQCMEHYLREEIGSMRVQHLNCPHCQLPLPNDLIRSLIDTTTYNKYRQFIRNLQIQKNPNLKWCPNPKCSVVVSTNPNKKTSKCPKCATQICNRCNREAHPKTSCQGAFHKQIKNWQNASDIQKCKKCHGLVEKIAGCNHMTCSLCHYQWCWLCGSEYTTAHFSALNPFGCPGLQDRPRDDWGKCKIFLLRLGILFLILIGIPIMVPVAMVAVGPVLATQLLFDCFYPETCCKKAGIIILASILGTIANPIVWIGCIFYFIPKGIIRLRDWYRQRQGIEQRRNHFLQQRLLGEQIYQQKVIE